MRIIGLKNCDTCKKALKALDAAGVSYTYIDVRADGVEAADLSALLEAHGADKVVNKRSTTWRTLPDEERVRAEDNATCIDLLLENPTLMKRPAIFQDGETHLGWTAKTQEALGL